MPNETTLDFIRKIFSIDNLGLTGLDIIIIIILLFYVYEGYASGFFNSFLDFAGFVISFVLGIKFYSELGAVIAGSFFLPIGVSSAIAFFVIAFFSELVFHVIFKIFKLRLAIPKIPEFEPKEQTLASAYIKTLDKSMGAVMGGASGFVLVAFIITVFMAFPFSPVLKKSLTDSKISGFLIANTFGLEKAVNSVLGGAIDETINFLTIRPNSNEEVLLYFKIEDGVVDEKAEALMLEAVNRERTSRGQSFLSIDLNLKEVARSHAKDMLKRGYFSHYTPEGYSPFDRLVAAGITYQAAGENLAFAPNTALAMQGLMDSPGHRKNILSPDFGRVGIGVVDAGVYGQMFVQEFAD